MRKNLYTLHSSATIFHRDGTTKVDDVIGILLFGVPRRSNA
jgi:hypothetical protein